MPLIKVQTSLTDTTTLDVESLLKSLSASLAQQLGKPETYVMTAFEAGVPMTHAGTTAPACYVEIKSVGTMGAKTQTMTTAFCDQLAAALGIARDRIYIFFDDVKGSMWGWDGRTFG
ncbi:MAG: phenylpyruvate tautomerase MIF-related protein [Cyanobacteria bacterium J06648_11]